MRFDTDLVNYCPAPGDQFDPSSPPIYQTATGACCAKCSRVACACQVSVSSSALGLPW